MGVITLLFLTGSVPGGVSPTRIGVNPPAATGQIAPPPASKISPEVQTELEALAPGEKLTVIIRFQDQVDLQEIAPVRAVDRPTRLRTVIAGLQEQASRTQASIRPWLDTAARAGQIDRVIHFWIFNGISLSATPRAIIELASRPDVRSITSDQADIVPLDEIIPAAVETNIGLINAPQVWALGYQGEGMVIASLDTGVYLDHPDLKAQWRGGSNSWFDPYGQYPTPTDSAGQHTGHGTATMGVMVGRSAGGSTIGVAPNAQWIAARLWNNQGGTQATKVHQAYQWILDPDGIPGTDDAPDVVNNSWGYPPGCNLEFQDDVQILRAAGILPVFSAGNAGPAPETGTSPGNNPGAFAVGATDNANRIANFSSRGPSQCDETVYPEIVAPGWDILTTNPQGGYSPQRGTSFAAPHVTAGVALLLQAFPSLSADEQEAVLISTTVDLGDRGPENTYGNGRLDLASAFRCVQEDTCLQSFPRAYFPLVHLFTHEFMLRLFLPYIGVQADN